MRYLLIFFTLFLLVNCSSVPKEYLSNDTICHYDDPIFNISQEELTMDKGLLEEIKKTKKDTVLVDNKFFKDEYWYPDKYSENITNKQTNKQTNILKNIGYNLAGKIKWVEFKYINPYINIYKEFYYDEQGNITEVIDYEKGYNICWAEAIEIVKRVAKKEIEKYEVTGFNLSHNNLNEFPNAKPVWQITLDGNEEYELKPVTVYWIDGVTGKFLRTTKITTSYD